MSMKLMRHNTIMEKAGQYRPSRSIIYNYRLIPGRIRGLLFFLNYLGIFGSPEMRSHAPKGGRFQLSMPRKIQSAFWLVLKTSFCRTGDLRFLETFQSCFSYFYYIAMRLSSQSLSVFITIFFGNKYNYLG